MDYKKAFYLKLEDCYLGAKIKNSQNQAKNGFTNLLVIKEKYFQKIKDYLDTQNLYTDTYNKLYNFFSTYLNETGTPFFYDTPMYKNIYARVYSNSKDTSLFYKTQNLYYVKSDTIYNPLSLQSEDKKYTLNFLTDEYEQNADNNKSKINFYLQNIQDDNINIKVINSKNNDGANVFKQNSSEFSDVFLKTLKNAQINIKEEELKKLFKTYKKQNEVDFFIHKNAKEFLKEQFDLWLFSYVNDSITDWTKEKIDEINDLKQIAFAIIDMIADFENELKAIWLKPKFAKNAHYVFSLDTIKSHSNNADEILNSIYKDINFNEQIAEWKELNFINDEFDIKAINDEKYKFLPLDTKYLSEENYYKLLQSFENLDEILNGELVKADNFQALNSLMPKYQGKIDLIYIDPPYNTGNDGFVYTDKFNHSSWLAMMKNRLDLAKEFLKNSGSIFISIDDNEQARLKILCDEVFGEENFVANVIWRKRAGGGNDSNHIAVEQEYINIYAKNIEHLKTYGIARTNISQYKKDEKGYYLEKPLNDTSLQDSPGLHYDIKLPSGKILKGSEHQWKVSENTFYSRLERDEIIFKNNDKVYYKHYIDIASNLKPSSIWYDFVLNADATNEIKLNFENKIFDTPKPEKLLKRICDIGSNQNSLVLDFFVGSGTTIATAHKLKRKWLGVEMGEHFYKVIIPRMKKVLNGFVCGISKEVEFKGGGAFRYYELESYEESLENCEYILSSDNALIDYRKSRKLIKGLKKGENIYLDMSKYDKNFDIFVTMSNLLGLKIKNIFIDDNGIKSCRFENGDTVNLENIDLIKYPKLKNLIWWEK
ncbi:site-specific DNA-methyltransferase [Campylobacter jejuni]|uniref:site-specific DNA-methyltransferase n=1 Tax=Campylobacter jejuni TaxID=197 RepID=UPI0012899E94|nr:DNA methyltransferase [Campylobacter jejuni]EAH6881037.1 site-specific DNA-methyltransferase [Campylobacter jejuni]EAH9956385.1 site-specific DNA-methyltransferase [Campylobacter jejuni]EAH9972121.1 site-specific DNA-methyltransferase [Campylobacter jejuni]EAL7779490.1 site-specific DNA-methyltransferase [Campylobacter jejuni]EAM0795143.1 site-specific DNA-methyltransferase [Campylobacter jejuni]